MHVCCGNGCTFGCCYDLPNTYITHGYTPNEAIINHKQDPTDTLIHFNSTESTYKNSSTFSIKEYI